MEGYLVYLRKSRSDGEHESVEEVLARHEKLLQEHAVNILGEPVPESCIYREVVSGETIQDRPEVRKLLDRIQQEPVRGVLTIEPQRLSRGDLSDCGTIIRAFRYTDTLIITPSKTYDLSDKFDRKFFEMELTRGNDYLEYIKEIMMRGRLASVSEGNFIGSIPPYGYDKVRAGKSYTLAPNDEADTVRLIFRLWTEEKLGTTRLANKLNELGIRPRKGDYWTCASIRDMLHNPVYIGKIRWNWRKTVKSIENGEIRKTRPKSPEDSWIMVEGKHPAIIDEKTFDAAQALFGNAPRNKVGKELTNPLAGMIRCECGKAMILQPQQRSAPRLHCRHQTHCGNKSATYEAVEEAVIAQLSELIEHIEVMIRNGEDPASVNEDIIRKLSKELNDIETQQDKLYDLLEQGVYTNAVFLRRNQALAERREKCRSALDQAKAAGSPVPLEKRRLMLMEAIGTLRDNTVSPKEKNELLRLVIREIKYSRQAGSRTKWDTTPFNLEISFNF